MDDTLAPGASAPAADFYRYSPDRKGEQAEVLLGDCRGFLHADVIARIVDHPINRINELLPWH